MLYLFARLPARFCWEQGLLSLPGGQILDGNREANRPFLVPKIRGRRSIAQVRKNPCETFGCPKVSQGNPRDDAILRSALNCRSRDGVLQITFGDRDV